MPLLKQRELFLSVPEADVPLQTNPVQPRHQGNLSLAKVCRQVLRSVHVMALAQSPARPSVPQLRLRFGLLVSSLAFATSFAERLVRGRYLLQDDADRLIAQAEASRVLK